MMEPKRCDYCFKMFHSKDECSFMFWWNQQRVLWIGQKEKDCILNRLPREIIMEIISHVIWQPFQDLLPIVKKLKTTENALSIGSFCLIGSYLFKKYEKYFKNVKCYKPGHCYCPFMFNNHSNDFTENETQIIESYGMKIYL